jgi:hypothetical protein
MLGLNSRISFFVAVALCFFLVAAPASGQSEFDVGTASVVPLDENTSLFIGEIGYSFSSETEIVVEFGNEYGALESTVGFVVGKSVIAFPSKQIGTHDSILMTASIIEPSSGKLLGLVLIDDRDEDDVTETGGSTTVDKAVKAVDNQKGGTPKGKTAEKAILNDRKKTHVKAGHRIDLKAGDYVMVDGTPPTKINIPTDVFTDIDDETDTEVIEVKNVDRKGIGTNKEVTGFPKDPQVKRHLIYAKKVKKKYVVTVNETVKKPEIEEFIKKWKDYGVTIEIEVWDYNKPEKKKTYK